MMMSAVSCHTALIDGYCQHNAKSAAYGDFSCGTAKRLQAPHAQVLLAHKKTAHLAESGLFIRRRARSG